MEYDVLPLREAVKEKNTVSRKGSFYIMKRGVQS